MVVGILCLEADAGCIHFMDCDYLRGAVDVTVGLEHGTLSGDNGAEETAAELDCFFRFFGCFHSCGAPFFGWDLLYYREKMCLVPRRGHQVLITRESMHRWTRVANPALFMTKFCEDTAYFVQKLSDALCRGVLAGGYILKIVATGFQPHDFHLLFGDALCEIMQEKFDF